MIATAAALLATAAVASVPVSVSARLAAAERTLSALEATGCPDGVDPASVLRDLEKGTLAPDAAKAADASRETLRLYYSCRAYAAGSADACAPLARTPARVAFSVDKSALKRPDTLEFLCASDLHDMRMARAAIAGDAAAFVAACKAHDAAGHRDFVRGKVDEACAILAGGRADPKAACARLGPLFSNPAPAGFCEGELRQFAGDAAHCRTIEGQPASRELCLGYAAWKGARRDPSACGDSAVCRVLAGQGESACEPLAARALRPVCAAGPASAALNRVAEDLDAVEKDLSVGAVEDRAAAGATDAAAEAAARARLRLTALVAATEKKP